MNTWNKSFSIFYATIADSSSIKSMNLHKLNQILLNLSNKWDCDSGIINNKMFNLSYN